MTGNSWRTIAVITGLALGPLWLVLENYGDYASRRPGDAAILEGNSHFNDGHYERAVRSYAKALAGAPAHLPALRGLANAQIQLKRYAKALAAVGRAIRLDPAFGGHYATRGIVFDFLGEHKSAIADYERALRLDPTIADSMSWLDRVFYNVQQRPPTVADRLAYLKAQMALPPSKRVLRRPQIDAAQRPYER